MHSLFQEDNTALLLACEGGHVQVVQKLLSGGASIHAQNMVRRDVSLVINVYPLTSRTFCGCSEFDVIDIRGLLYV